ncbi:MAG: hypothetical protein IT548_09305 [Alphaproteobacteria bacterium]|nr:hypothetical protein [Alphaproteobacteria bacterium]
MSRLRFAVIALAAGLLAACFPEFAQPVGTGAPVDPELVGTWRAAPKSDPNDVMMLTFSAEGDGMTLVMAPPEPGDEKPLVLKGRAGRGPAGTAFVSLKPQGEDVDAATGYYVFRYAPDGTGFKVWSLDAEKLAAAVNSGKLAGTTGGQGTDTTVKITAPPDVAAAFLESAEGQALFRATDEDVLILTKATR